MVPIIEDMARARRNDSSGAWHHVMNRGSDRQDIFGCDADFVRFERLLADVVETTAIEVHAYCLMTNHFHLLVHCPDGGLSTAMQRLEQHYTQWYNSNYERDGPLYRGRFKSVAIDSDEQLTTVGRYIHRNPTALVPAGALSAYRWSSAGVYTARRARPDWLTTERLSAPFGSNPAHYRAFIEQELPSDGLRQGTLRRLSIADVIAGVARTTGLDESTIRRAGRGVANPARLVAISLAVEVRAASVADLADYFGLASASSVRGLARRGRVLTASDDSIATLHRSALAAAIAGEL